MCQNIFENTNYICPPNQAYMISEMIGNTRVRYLTFLITHEDWMRVQLSGFLYYFRNILFRIYPICNQGVACIRVFELWLSLYLVLYIRANLKEFINDILKEFYINQILIMVLVRRCLYFLGYGDVQDQQIHGCLGYSSLLLFMIVLHHDNYPPEYQFMHQMTKFSL